jgi:hypothetical protein
MDEVQKPGDSEEQQYFRAGDIYLTANETVTQSPMKSAIL